MPTDNATVGIECRTNDKFEPTSASIALARLITRGIGWSLNQAIPPIVLHHYWIT